MHRVNPAAMPDRQHPADRATVLDLLGLHRQHEAGMPCVIQLPAGILRWSPF